MKRSVSVLTILIVAAFVVNVSAQFSLNRPPSEQKGLSNLASQPLCFTENRGQWDEKALFKAEAGGIAFWYCKGEVIYQFTRDTDKLLEDGQSYGPGMIGGMLDKLNHLWHKKESMVVRAQFVGLNPDVGIIGEDRLPYNNNYFIGNNRSKWATDVPNYSAITYKNIYPGIDLKYHGDGKGMKYDFIVNPGADISQIRIKYDGVENLSVTNQGDLEAQTRFGSVYEKIPEIYQEINGQKRSVSGQYILHEPGIFGFKIAEGCNPSYPVVIDPELVYSTYLGGIDIDDGFAVAIDGSGNAYVTGSSSSYNFPVVNPYHNYNNGSDIFISKISSNGNSLLYSTFLGGVYDDVGYSIAVDNIGNAYIAGTTQSNNFPTVNAFDSSYNGGTDAIVAKLSLSGNVLLYSTYLGGNNGDFGRGIAINNAGNAVVTGFTQSSNFPIVNAYDANFNGGGTDAFISKLSTTGNALEFSTFFGGDDNDYGFGIALDDSENVYITGATSSPDLPLADAFQDTLLGYSDVYVASFHAGGSALRYCTYLGGTNGELGMAIDLDNMRNAYIAGFTTSSDFPVVGTYDPTYNLDYEDAFVSKFARGDSLVYSTYLGGHYEDEAWGISVDGSGSAYVTGYTLANDFPVVNPFEETASGFSDIFVTKFDTSGLNLEYSTYLGGSGNEYGRGIAVDEMGNATIVGYSTSSNYPRANAYDSSFNGGDDVVITRFAAPVGIDDQKPLLPNDRQLSQNYPNPFNAQTTIRYSLPEQSEVSIDIFDILGRKIETLNQGVIPAGNHQAIWDASGQSSGIYFYRIKAGDKIEAKKMVLMK